MNTVELISALGGLAGIGTMVWYALNLRSKRRMEKAAADSAAAEADGKVADNWQNFAEKIEKRYNELEQKYRSMEQRQMRLERALSTTTNHKRYAEYHICTDLACPTRKPPIGTFKTEDFTDILKTDIETEKEHGD